MKRLTNVPKTRSSLIAALVAVFVLGIASVGTAHSYIDDMQTDFGSWYGCTYASEYGVADTAPWKAFAYTHSTCSDELGVKMCFHSYDDWPYYGETVCTGWKFTSSTSVNVNTNSGDEDGAYHSSTHYVKVNGQSLVFTKP